MSSKSLASHLPPSQVLLDSFEDSIKTLRELGERNQRRVEKLEHVCASQEKEHAARLRELEGTYQVIDQNVTLYC